MQPIYSACPVVRTESVSLMRWLDADGLGGMEVVRFRREILWIRETEAHVLFLHGGERLRDGASYSDYGALLSCQGDAVECAAAAARAYSVDRDSTLEILVRSAIRETPVLDDESADGKSWNGRSRRYRPIPRDWLLHNEDKATRWLAAKSFEERLGIGLESLEARVVAEADVWSSKRTRAENEAALEAFGRSALMG